MSFANASHLERLIDAYFEHINGEFHFEDAPGKNHGDDEVTQKKVWDRPAEPATLSGLAVYLGFDSIESFNEYKSNGQYSGLIKRAKLRVEAEYEKKLYQPSSSGAIFALKILGWDERNLNATNNNVSSTLTILHEYCGIPVVYNEQDVDLS